MSEIDPTNLETTVPTAIGTTLAACVVEPEIEVPPECPPPCSEDPNAIVVNWTRQTKPFLNKQTCEYSVTLKTEYEGLSEDQFSLLEPYKTTGVMQLLDYYGKAEVFVDEATGEEKNALEICLGVSEISDTYVDTRPFIKMIVLVTVPSSVFDTIPEALPPPEPPDKEDMPAYVSIKAPDFFKMVRQVSRAMKIYGVKYAVWVQNAGGRLSEPSFDPIEEAERLRNFRKDFKDFVRANDFAIRKPSPWGKRWAEEFEIGFNEKMKIQYVKIAEISCDLEQITKTFGYFKNIEPQTIQRTMYYVSRLPDMWTDVTATEPPDWSDFFTKYTAFPPLEIVAGEALISSVEQDPSACTGWLTDPINGFLNGIVDGIVSLPDAFADRFAQNLCLDLHGKEKQDVDFKDIDDITKRALDAAMREMFAGDNVLEMIPELLRNVRSLEDLWTEVLDKLGICGLLALLMMAFECLFAGLSLEDSLKPMIKAALNAMGKPVFELLMIGLPEDAKMELKAKLADEFKNIPPPWEAGYRAGSYSGAGKEISVDAHYDGHPTSVSGSGVYMQPTATELLEGYSDLRVAVETNPATSADQPAASFMGGGGSIGTAAGNMQEALFAAYLEALIQCIDENLIDLDMLMEQLNQLPGAEIIARAFSMKDCPPGPPLFSPPIFEFFKTLELDFCRGHFAISLPKLNKIGIPDLWKILINTAKEILKELIVMIIILAITMIIELLLGLLCKLLAAIGALAVEALTGGNDFRGALSDALCDEDPYPPGRGDAASTLDVGIDPLADVDPESVDAAVGNILGSLGLLDVEDADAVPSTEVANNFINTISALLTNSELIELLEGNASDATLQMIADVVGDQIPELAHSLGQPSAIRQFFAGMGGIINREVLERASVITERDMPTIRSICASPAELERFNDLRCRLLERKGLSSPQCQEQIQALTDRAQQDLANLAQMANEGILPESALPAILGNNPIDPVALGEALDPDCPATASDLLSGGSLLPATPDSMSEVKNVIQRGILDTIGVEWQRDLVDRRGFLNMVLSDSNGRGYKGHRIKKWWLGDDLAQDIGFFEFYVDNYAGGLDGEEIEEGKQWYFSGADAAADRDRDTPSDEDLDAEMPTFEERLATGVGGNVNNFITKLFGSAFGTKKPTGGYPLSVGSLVQAYMFNYSQEVATGLGDLSGITMRTELATAPNVPGWGTNKKFTLKFNDYEEAPDEGAQDRRYGTEIRVTAASKFGGRYSSEDMTRTEIFEKFEGAVSRSIDIRTMEVKEIPLYDFRVTAKFPSGVRTLISELDVESMLDDYPLPTVAFAKYIEKIWLEASGGPLSGDIVGLLLPTGAMLPDIYMRKLSLWAATGAGTLLGGDAGLGPSDGRSTKVCPAYQYGYKETQTSTKIIMAGPEISTVFKRANGRGDRSRYESNEEFDAMIYERFGGNETNPPYYWSVPEREGWLGMMDKLVPSPDACDPLDGSVPRGPISLFDDLADNQNNLSISYVDDERLGARPTSECAWDMPYGEIFSKGAAAGVDTAISAVIRIYAVEALMKGLPVFMQFGPECFDLIVGNYVSLVMDGDLKNQGPWGFPSQKYYYKFMEQVVQMFGRQVDAGFIEPTPDEQTAMNNLNARQLAWNRTRPPAMNKVAYWKSLFEEVEAALYEEDNRGVPGIRVLLSRFVLEELGKMSEILNAALYPGTENRVKSIHTDLMLASNIFVDGCYAGDDLTDGLAYREPWNGIPGDGGFALGSGKDVEFEANSWPPTAPVTSAPAKAGISPFRMERYIRIVEKEGGSGIAEIDNRPDHQKGILRISEFVDFVSEIGPSVEEFLASANEDAADEDELTTFADIFSNIRVGLRLCFVPPTDSADQQAIGITGGLGGFASSAGGIDRKVILQEKAFKVDTFTGPVYLTPLAATEIDFVLESYDTIEILADNAEAFMDDNMDCLVDNLADTDPYKMIFETCIPLKKMVSWLAIYNVMNFLPAIGWAQDGWNVQGGKWVGFFSGFRTWNRKTFDDSKKQARRVFLSYYHGNDPSYKPEESEKKMPKKKIDIKIDLPWWKISREVEKPTDKNDVLCP